MLLYILIASIVPRTNEIHWFNRGSAVYEDTLHFQSLMLRASEDVMSQISMIRGLAGFELDELVDIEYYAQHIRISGQNESGIAYQLGDLLEWGRVHRWAMDYQRLHWDTVVVATKPEGTFSYYYLDDFEQLWESGQFTIVSEGVDVSVLGDIENLDLNGSYIADADGEILYIDLWYIRDALPERFAPVGAESLLELVNENPQWNGRLSEIYRNLETTLINLADKESRYQSRWSYGWIEGNSNFIYLFVDETTEQVWTNREEFNDYQRVRESINAITSGQNIKYFITRGTRVSNETNLVDSRYIGQLANWFEGDGSNELLIVAVDMNLPIQDDFYFENQAFHHYIPFLQSYAGLFIGSIGVLLAALVWLTAVAGRSHKDKEVKLIWFDRWKTELAAGIVIGLWGILIVYLFDLGSNHFFHIVSGGWISLWQIVFVGVGAAFTTAMFLIGYLSLVRRIKAKTVWKNSLLCWGIQLVVLFWNNRKITWKAVLLLCGFIVVHWLAIVTMHILFILLMLLVDAAAIAFVVIYAVGKSRIKEGIKQIASGDIHYQIPLNNLRGENLATAELVNSIGTGLQNAVEESMRSERMKTDLITNVSHDIKTPLTSIINYVDLLKRENLEDPKIQGYLDILEAKAQRLKVLTENVVEASKASSGNVTLECINLNLVEMLHQAEGEFEERFSDKSLTLVTNIPEESVIVHVDGQRMWRILENAFSNVVKYAMPGTRVYLDLAKDGKTVAFSLKNISEQPLNISAEELTERFIRGDVSRHTEGSGLGLSIAKSLTELQGGSFRLYLDGDLFKVIIEFSVVEVE